MVNYFSSKKFKKSLFNDFKRLNEHISRKRKAQFVVVFLLSVLSALAEMATLGTIVPFLVTLTSSVGDEKNKLCGNLFGACGMSPEEISIVFITMVFIGLVVRSLALYETTKFAYSLGDDLANEIYCRILNQPYQYHLTNNTSQVVGGLNKVTGLVANVMMPLLQGGLALISSIAIFVALVNINAIVALIAILIIAFFYYCISLTTNKILRKFGSTIAKTEVTKVQALQEGLGGIREILLGNTQHVYLKSFNDINTSRSYALSRTKILQGLPRYIIEAVGIMLLIALALWISARQGVSAALPILGALALGAQRLLPQMQQIYGALSSIQNGHAVISDVLKMLDLPLPSTKFFTLPSELPIAKNQPIIALKAVSFNYESGSKLVLNQINLEIYRGSRIGIIGKTGSGKSTLVDLMMGLLDPTAGQLLVENTILSNSTRPTWFNRIAHVPQAIYLSDATLAENIAFGIKPELINMNNVQMAAEKAQISEFINELPDQYMTYVGERGVRLSGGQRQRIGLARALYKKSDFLVLDEATSALDDSTENAVMNAINSLGESVTVIIIAHRLSTLRNCQIIYELDKGRVIKEGGYLDVIGSRIDKR